jgi:predicted deacylase
MNATARMMKTLRCAATHLKTSNLYLQHASNTQCTQALARQAQRTAQHARSCSSTCTFFTRPRVARSITISAQLHDMWAMCISAGAVASRWHANATQGSMRRTRPHGEHSAKLEPRGGSACCRR